MEWRVEDYNCANMTTVSVSPVINSNKLSEHVTSVPAVNSVHQLELQVGPVGQSGEEETPVVRVSLLQLPRCQTGAEVQEDAPHVIAQSQRFTAPARPVVLWLSLHTRTSRLALSLGWFSQFSQFSELHWDPRTGPLWWRDSADLLFSRYNFLLSPGCLSSWYCWSRAVATGPRFVYLGSGGLLVGRVGRFSLHLVGDLNQLMRLWHYLATFSLHFPQSSDCLSAS